MAVQMRSVEEEVRSLQRALTALRRRVEALEAAQTGAVDREAAPGPAGPGAGPAPLWAATGPGDDAGSTPRGRLPEAAAGEAPAFSFGSLFARAAAVCFLLVAALVLRTLTDAELVPRSAGSALGLAYGLSLLVVAWNRYARRSPVAPVFAATGALLTYGIVWETHARFEALPGPAAYGVLILAAVWLAVLARRASAPLPAGVGLLGATLVAVALDFPHPDFPLALAALLAISLAALAASRLPRTGWVAWTTLGLTLLLLEVWTEAAVRAVAGPVPAGVRPALFPAGVVVVAGAWLAAATGVLGRTRAGPPPRVALALPPLATVWALQALWRILAARATDPTGLGLAALALAAGAFVLSDRFARRGAEAPGVSFALTGTAALAVAALVLVGPRPLALPLLSATALGLFGLALRRRSPALRLVAYLLQLAVLAALVRFVQGAGAAASPELALAALLLAVLAAAHWAWARRAGPARTGALAAFDPGDVGAAALLVGAVAAGFFAAREVLHAALGAGPGGAAAAFGCGQSMLLSAAAGGLAGLAWLRRSRELRSVAILVTAAAALKVFLFDLVRTSGVPLVLSVLTFGLAAGLVSLVLRRWPRRGPAPTPPPAA